MIVGLVIVVAAATSGTATGAATPVARAAEPPASSTAPSRTLRVDPPRARPGDAILLTVTGVRPADAGTVSATVQGRKVHFYPTTDGVQAIAPLPVELKPGTIRIDAFVAPAATSGTAGSATSGTGDGASERIQLSTTVEVIDPAFPETKLSVEPKYFAPSPEEQRWKEEDTIAFREAFGRPFEAPLFSGTFARPRTSNVTGRYGERRTFNGKQQSQHYGTDLAGAVGEPVLSANDGVVVLVRDCFASGKSIAIAHGGGLFTVYFHLSGAAVRAGDRVTRGQPIGKVGATGRVTGPHLHFGVKIADAYVDPESVFRLGFSTLPVPAASPPAEPRTPR